MWLHGIIGNKLSLCSCPHLVGTSFMAIFISKKKKKKKIYRKNSYSESTVHKILSSAYLKTQFTCFPVCVLLCFFLSSKFELRTLSRLIRKLLLSNLIKEYFFNYISLELDTVTLDSFRCFLACHKSMKLIGLNSFSSLLFSPCLGISPLLSLPPSRPSYLLCNWHFTSSTCIFY